METLISNGKAAGNGAERATGTVKFFRADYGFITPDDGGDDVFVHYTAIDAEGYRRLYEGDRVSFAVTTTPKGLAARQVRRLTEFRPGGGL